MKTSYPSEPPPVANDSLILPFNEAGAGGRSRSPTPSSARAAHRSGIGGTSVDSTKSTGVDHGATDVEASAAEVVELPSLGASLNDGLHPATVPFVTPTATTNNPTQFLFGQRVCFAWSSDNPPVCENAASMSGAEDLHAIIARFTPSMPNEPVASHLDGSLQISSGALSWAHLPTIDRETPAAAVGTSECTARDSALRLMMQHDVWTTACVMAPSARFGHVAIALDHERVLVHGGRDQTTYLADLWMYHCPTGSWRELVREDGADWPTGRSGHTAVTFNDGTVYFYGGAITHENTTTELWALNTHTWSWTLVDSGSPSADGINLANAGGAIGTPAVTMPLHLGPSSEVKRPRNRKGHTAVHIQGTMYVYGGATQDNVADPHVWTWSPAHGWDVILNPPHASPPTPRKYHVAVATTDGKMVVFGGQEVIPLPPALAGAAAHQAIFAAPCLSDVIVFDPVSCRWYAVDCRGHIPAPRMCSTGILRGDCLAIFDGADANGVHVPSCYELHLRTGVWTKAATTVHPRVRGANRGVSVRCGHTLFHFGGHAGREFTREVVHLQLRPPLLSDCAKRWLARCSGLPASFMGLSIGDLPASFGGGFVAT